MKKILAFVLAAAMILSMAVAVSADEWSVDCSAGFGAARSEALPISTEVSSWTFTSTTDADAVNNWDSAIVEVSAGSVWAMTLRSDAYGWGEAGYQLSTTANLPGDDAAWAAWREANKAGVACTVTAQIVEAEDSNYIVVGVSNNGVIGVYTFPTTETTGSLVLTGENCVLTGLTASADHIDMSETIAKVTAPKAAITPDPNAIDTVGTTDLTLAWWSDFTNSYELVNGETTTVKLNNYSYGDANYKNFVLGFATTPLGGEGYAEYAVVRADAYGWGDASYSGTFTTSWTTDDESTEWGWAPWREQMKDAEVTIDITRADSQINLDMTFVGADGTVMTEQAVITSTLTAEAPCYFFITGEACYIELLSVSGVEEEAPEWIVDSPAWWAGHSAPVVITEERQSWKFTSTTYANATDLFDTATAVVWRSDDGLMHTLGEPGYIEELIVRSDCWAVSEERPWGSPKGQLTWSVKNYPANWDEWLNANKAGAEVIVTAQLVDGYIVVGYSNNGVFNVYSVPVDANSTSPVYLSITGEECTMTGWTETDEHLPIDDAVAAPADPTNPETGDNTAIHFVVMACVLSLAALVVVSKKRFAI